MNYSRLAPDYFNLRKPIERRIYEIARKHCGDQELFKIGLEKLQLKVGCLRAMRRHDTLLLSGDRSLPVGRPGESLSQAACSRSKRNRQRKRMRQPS